ncbi:hypothetical protein ZOSMA_2G01750 [Zostera marina]|uniref:DUF7046 domain-containing protein n=1 Tax=Zostera marina TaxID=29655 RepID=A0A0K9PB25_ZOSMR|nr:hypothetical protein ZOSMA_2G01750 [Zostera marina]
MGAYEPGRSEGVKYEGHQLLDQFMEGGEGDGNLSDKFSGLGLDVGGSSNTSIFQVMKAVQDAEYTIRKQMEENEQLKEALLQKTNEIEKYKLNTETLDEQVPRLHKQVESSIGTKSDKASSIGNSFLLDTMIIHQDGVMENEANYNHGVSQYSLSSSRSVSPSRHQKGEFDNKLDSSSNGRVEISGVNRINNPLKQDLILKVKEREEEILQLRRHLTDYSIKEAHICNEKSNLEKRLAFMRKSFDQQQQDLVDAASKALSYRQDIIEENIHLTYALQSAQQERSTYVSSLLPLLSEYGLQPSVPDAISIVGNLKVLFRHLHEKLVITEEKLNESHYQVTPWHADAINTSNITPQSPSNSFRAAHTSPYKYGLEIVPQPPYPTALSPIASPSNNQTREDWELGHQTSSGGFISNSPNYYKMGNSSVGRNFMAEDMRVAVGPDDSHVGHVNAEGKEKNSKNHTRDNEMDDPETVGSQHHRDSSYDPYLPKLEVEDRHAPSYLPPVLEEPNSSFSDDDDPLPAIEDLQFSGEAYPGRELQACGISTNGTTSCNFEWVRYLEDGSVNYIEYAKQPAYLVTADDVDCYLAIEVQPLDDRKRKGELVKVFANDHRKITCDPEMQDEIEKIYSLGHTSFQVSISAGALSIWEHAVLAIKAEGYSIKCMGTRGVVVTDKFSQNTEISIPYEQSTDFSIVGCGGRHLLRANSSAGRDTIVLTLRLFKIRAVEKRKGKKRVLFFNLNKQSL